MPRFALWAAVIAALLLFGMARLPLERSLDEAHRAASLDVGLREQIGQLAYAAALSGFRSLVAAFLWIEAHTEPPFPAAAGLAEGRGLSGSMLLR